MLPPKEYLQSAISDKSPVRGAVVRREYEFGCNDLRRLKQRTLRGSKKRCRGVSGPVAAVSLLKKLNPILNFILLSSLWREAGQRSGFRRAYEAVIGGVALD